MIKDFKKGDFIGIYTFYENSFSVGEVKNITKDYLFLKNYDVNYDVIGIKVFLLSSIKRIIKSSKYIKNLKDKIGKKISYEEVNSIKDILNKIIKNKILVSVELADDSKEEGYLIKKNKNLFYFEFLDDSLKMNTREVMVENYINEIEIICENLPDIDNSKLKLLKSYSSKEYVGNILFLDKNYILLNFRKEFSEKKYLKILSRKTIKEISYYIPTRKFKFINDFLEKIKFDVKELVKFALKNKIIVSIDCSDFDTNKIGIINDISEEKIQLKLLDERGNFVEICEIFYSNIEIFQLYNKSIFI